MSSPTTTRAEAGRAWPAHLLAAALLAAVAIAATSSVWRRIFAYALSSEEQSHSLLAVPVAAWLVWVRRHRFDRLAPAGSLWGPVVLALGWLTAVAGFRGSIDLAIGAGAILIVLGAVLAVLGPRVFLAVLPAVGALAMILPVPGRLRGQIAGPLQEASASITASVIDLVGIPIEQSGNLLTVNGVDVAIAEACNGMRMVSALALVAYAFVFTLPLRPWARLLILALSPLLALAVNIVRLIPTTLFYGYASTDTADLFHDVSGWGVLFVAVALLWGTTSLLRWLELPIDRGAQPRPPSHAPARAHRSAQGAAIGAAAALAVSILILGGFDAKARPGVEDYFARARAAVDAVPYRLGSAVGIDQEVSPGTTKLLRPNALLQRRYTNPITGDTFGLTIVHCADSRDLVGHYPPVCYPRHGWTVESQAEVRLQTAGPADHPADEPAAEPGDKPGAEPGIPARLYTVSLTTELGVQRSRVVSFFALPDRREPYSPAMESVVRSSRSAEASGLGAAHILLTFPGPAQSSPGPAASGPGLDASSPESDETLLRDCNEIISAIAPALHAITRGDPAGTLPSQP